MAIPLHFEMKSTPKNINRLLNCIIPQYGQIWLLFPIKFSNFQSKYRYTGFQTMQGVMLIPNNPRVCSRWNFIIDIVLYESFPYHLDRHGLWRTLEEPMSGYPLWVDVGDGLLQIGYPLWVVMNDGQMQIGSPSRVLWVFWWKGFIVQHHRKALRKCRLPVVVWGCLCFLPPSNSLGSY